MTAATDVPDAVVVADVHRLEVLFAEHSSAAVGESASSGKGAAAGRHMDRLQFGAAMRSSMAGHVVGDHALDLLFVVADREGRGVLSAVDFVMLHDLLLKPNAEFDFVFRFFDINRNGKVSYTEFQEVLSKYAKGRTTDLRDSTYARLYFGADGKKGLSYHEFAQFLRSIQHDNLYQSFKKHDPTESGFVSVESFLEIATALFAHRMSPFILEHLPSLGNLYITGGPKVSWALTNALNSVLRQLDFVWHVASCVAASSKDHRITKSAFLDMSHRLARFSPFTPMEVDIIFHFVLLHRDSQLPHHGQRGITMKDFCEVLALPQTASGVTADKLATLTTAVDITTKPPAQKPTVPPPPSPAWASIVRPVYNFTLGSVAGAIGATFVYPIDLVKTRMQNQRTAVVGELLYKNSWDCFKKVVRNEGFTGLYSGLGPQLVGVAPEKAIKLTMNDLMRGLLTKKNSEEIPLWGEVLAGCVAGGSQVVFTNPLEIVKIRLQIQGEVQNVQRRGAIDIVKELGMLGLYRGASACLLRDIPFSGIYFTAYAHLKKDYFGESETKKLNMLELLSAGAIAGMPAAYLTTPADVIKTRLQVEARKGESTYSGIMDAFRKIMREEGPRAFFKGGPARIFRSSPQFGVTLMSYELFKQWLPLPWDVHHPPTKVVHPALTTAAGGNVFSSTLDSPFTRPTAIADAGYLRMRNALQLLRDIDYRFGAPMDINDRSNTVSK